MQDKNEIGVAWNSRHMVDRVTGKDASWAAWLYKVYGPRRENSFYWDTVRDLMLAGFCLLFCTTASGQQFTVNVVKPEPTFDVRVVASEPVAETTSEKPRARYLVSEEYCTYCPAAKRKFLANGHPPENILTVAECKARFGFTAPHLPFEFIEPVRGSTQVDNTSENNAARGWNVSGVTSETPSKTAAMSRAEMVQLHNRLHGGGSWTWLGDLSTHLRTVHGVNTGAPVQSAPRVQQSGNCPTGNCPTNRSVRRRRGGLFGLFR